MFPEIFYDLDFQLENPNRSICVNSRKYPFKKRLAIWENKTQHCWVPPFEADCYLHFVAPVSILRV